jgi:NAD(P)-dependent dehydrogenase (short-subunit alcohol dehydrogenase family)
VAVVTGGNSGIGLGVAKAYAREGAQVAITGRNEKTLRAAAKEIGEGTLAIPSDAGKVADIEAAMNKIKERFNRIDAMFVNAGVAKLMPFEEITEEVFDETVEINMKGVFFTVQKAIPLMSKGSAIVLNGSINAHIGMAATSVYGATKAAVVNMAKNVLKRSPRARHSGQCDQSGANQLGAPARCTAGEDSGNQSLDSKPGSDPALRDAGGDCGWSSLFDLTGIRFRVGRGTHH